MSYSNDYRARRRHTLALMGASLLAAGLPRAALAQNARELRIGFQKYGTLTILKGRGTLEKRLLEKNVSVTWTEFPAGPVLLEGLNVGSIDFGTVGEAPPIFAQAAGADLVYVGHEPPSPKTEAIIVPKDSPLRTLADLRGKKIAVNKGSNAHYLLVKALEKAGVPYPEAQVIFLAPSDARAAFERGAIDAWSIWDPFLAAAEKQLGARVLADGTGLVANHQFYLAARSFARKQADIVAIVLDELAKVDAWGKTHPADVSAILARQTGLDLPVVALAASRYSYGVTPLSPSVVSAQQAIADTFTRLKLIPTSIVVKDAQLASRP